LPNDQLKDHDDLVINRKISEPAACVHGETVESLRGMASVMTCLRSSTNPCIDRRKKEVLIKKDAVRCLKRWVAREVDSLLRHDNLGHDSTHEHRSGMLMIRALDRGVSWMTLGNWPFGEPNTPAFGAFLERVNQRFPSLH
jgi:hypothetical protein